MRLLLFRPARHRLDIVPFVVADKVLREILPHDLHIAFSQLLAVLRRLAGFVLFCIIGTNSVLLRIGFTLEFRIMRNATTFLFWIPISTVP